MKNSLQGGFSPFTIDQAFRSGLEMEEKEEKWAVWMKEAQEGSSPSYERLLKEISKELEMILAKKIFEPIDREDLLQEILLALHRARFSYNSQRKFRPWYLAIVNYKIIDYIRSYKKAEKIVYSTEQMEQLISPVSPEKNTDYYDKLLANLKLLPEKQKMILTLTKLEGKSIKECCEITGMNPSAVKVTIHRAIKNLKRILMED